WRQALAYLPEHLNLPTDRPRPAQASYRGERLRFEIDAKLHGRLAELARASEATLFMVLHAVVSILLSRISGENDISIGTSIASRTDESLEGVVGCFVNLLVLRTDTAGNPTFKELLARVHTTDLAAYSHQDVPFERLVEMLNPIRSNAHHPLFQVLLV